MKWTLDKELEDTAKAVGRGFDAANRRDRALPPVPQQQPARDPDKANFNGLYKRGGAVKQPFSPPMGGAIGTARAQPKPSRADMGTATIGVTRSSRSYPKGK